MKTITALKTNVIEGWRRIPMENGIKAVFALIINIVCCNRHPKFSCKLSLLTITLIFTVLYYQTLGLYNLFRRFSVFLSMYLLSCFQMQRIFSAHPTISVEITERK